MKPTPYQIAQSRIRVRHGCLYVEHNDAARHIAELLSVPMTEARRIVDRMEEDGWVRYSDIALHVENFLKEARMQCRTVQPQGARGDSLGGGAA